MRAQLREILEALPQWRNRQRNRIQSVIEIPPEITLLDRVLEVPVRRGHDSDIGCDLAAASDSSIGSFLEETQKLRLQIEGHVAHLVEQE